MKKNDGGSAFLHIETDYEPHTIVLGMSLRDYFMAHAPITFEFCWVQTGKPDLAYVENLQRTIELLTNYRADYADAMLAERAK